MYKQQSNLVHRNDHLINYSLQNDREMRIVLEQDQLRGGKCNFIFTVLPTKYKHISIHTILSIITSTNTYTCLTLNFPSSIF